MKNIQTQFLLSLLFIVASAFGMKNTKKRKQPDSPREELPISKRLAVKAASCTRFRSETWPGARPAPETYSERRKR